MGDRIKFQLENGGYAEFEIIEDEAILVRWPRDKAEAVVPELVEGYRVTQIASLAFAPFHMDEKVLEKFKEENPMSFSMFCMKHASDCRHEREDNGGPESVTLPEGIKRIGAFAFLKCSNLSEIEVPKGVTEIEMGAFHGCIKLSSVKLPEGLERIGFESKDYQVCMPEIGTFGNCVKLDEIELPKTLNYLGAEIFNGSGLKVISVVDEESAEWSRPIRTHKTAFHHVASLCTFQKINSQKEILMRMVLPPKRDKILSCDREFGVINELPYHFFNKNPEELDRMAIGTRRMDFLLENARARIEYPGLLDIETEKWYLDYLTDYFDEAVKIGIDLSLLCGSRAFTRLHITRLLNNIVKNEIDIAILEEIIKIRNERFGDESGFEELELED